MINLIITDYPKKRKKKNPNLNTITKSLNLRNHRKPIKSQIIKQSKHAWIKQSITIFRSGDKFTITKSR